MVLERETIFRATAQWPILSLVSSGTKLMSSQESHEGMTFWGSCFWLFNKCCAQNQRIWTVKETLLWFAVLPHLICNYIFLILQQLTCASLMKFQFSNMPYIFVTPCFAFYIWGTLNSILNSLIFILHCNHLRLYLVSLIRLLVSWGQELFSCLYFLFQNVKRTALFLVST